MGMEIVEHFEKISLQDTILMEMINLQGFKNLAGYETNYILKNALYFSA